MEKLGQMTCIDIKKRKKKALLEQEEMMSSDIKKYTIKNTRQSRDYLEEPKTLKESFDTLLMVSQAANYNRA